jgi:aspartate racemase
MKKTLGVIGGMGPEATSYFYDEVIERTVASSDQEHINMVILNHAGMPDRTRAIKSGDDAALLSAMQDDLKKLEYCGADNIAIPCNTSHYFYDKIQAMTDIPIINMITETAREVAGMHLESGRIGIMATDGTIDSGVYHKALIAQNLVPVEPDPDIQKEIMSLIYDDIKAGKLGDEDKFHHALRNLRDKGCDMIILACTEISVYKRHHSVPHYCMDAMDILVRESILRSGYEYNGD